MDSIINWFTNNILSILNLATLILISLFGKNWINKKRIDFETSMNEDLEKIKSSLSKEQFIHKLQFEKEFQVYSELWEKLIALRHSTALIIHPSTAKKLDKSNEEDKREKEEILKKVTNSYDEAEKTIINNKPFYSEEVYKNADRILEESMRQIISWHYPHEDINSHYVIAKGRVDEITAIIGDIEEAIRERIRNIGEAKLIE